MPQLFLSRPLLYLSVIVYVPPPLAESSGGMSDIQFLLGNGHIKLRASRLKPIDVLQDHNGILYVVVRKVNPEVGTVGCPPLASRHWESKAGGKRKEGNLIGMSLP